jgi:pimeloyl-ACP methyl ester carboxylesterase
MTFRSLEARPVSNVQIRMFRRTVQGAGTGIFVSEAGSGPLLVAIHGIGSSGISWLPVLRPLAERFRLVTIDLRGHGKSSKPGSGYLLDDYADDLEAVLAAYGEAPHILGHSLGGLVAITWAKRHPATAVGILLEDMPMVLNFEQVDRLNGWADLAAMTVDEIVAFYRTEYPDWTEDDYRGRAEVMASTDVPVFLELRDRAMAGEGLDMENEARGITSPVCLLYGDVEAGGLVSLERAARFAAIGPNVTAVNIPGASHSIHRDSTEAFLKATFAFFDSLETGFGN